MDRQLLGGNGVAGGVRYRYKQLLLSSCLSTRRFFNMCS